ncbi:MAG: hypothetical protein ABSF74_06905 [Dehalococcoidia bacterium]|jgi:calcineurin-like phosphoesterase family protein
MTIYFTADLHLHHGNIIRYAHRNPPFRNWVEMDKGLIANWNGVVANTDKVYHLGDFCYTPIQRNDKHSYEKAMRICGEAMHKVHGQAVFLRGNHDNGLQHASYYIWRRVEGMKIFMRHWPPWFHPVWPPRLIHSFEIPNDTDLILCGHIHNKWKYRVHKIGQRKVPVINVGTDVWNYRPVSITNMMDEIEKLLTAKHGR